MINYLILLTQPENIGPHNVLTTSPSNAPSLSSKDPIWPSWGCPEMMSKGRRNLTFKGRSLAV